MTTKLTDRDALLAALKRSWQHLDAILNQIAPEDLERAADAGGWRGVDHVLHLAAWERSVSFLLDGRPRHLGLGVDEGVYASSDYEAINAQVHARGADVGAAEALRRLRAGHATLLTQLASLDDAALRRPCRAFYAAAEARWANRPVIDLIFGNTVAHFDEHRELIVALAEVRPSAPQKE